MVSVASPRANLIRTVVRVAVGFFAAALVLASIAFYFRWPVITNVWPWQGYYDTLSPMSFYFLSSIALAIAAPTLWIAITGKLHAAAPGALNLMVSFTGIAIFMFQGYLADPANTRLLVYALLLGASVVVIVVTYVLGRHMRGTDTRPLPGPVRYSFYVFIVALILVGGALVLKRPNVLPWPVTVEAGVVYGWIFLGAAVYFIYAVLNPLWDYAAGQLLGFLAYDIVLIIPFIRYFSEVQPQQLRSLVVYTIVVVYSALLAIYYLFINRETRLIRGAHPA